MKKALLIIGLFFTLTPSISVAGPVRFDGLKEALIVGSGVLLLTGGFLGYQLCKYRHPYKSKRHKNWLNWLTGAHRNDDQRKSPQKENGFTKNSWNF